MGRDSDGYPGMNAMADDRIGLTFLVGLGTQRGMTRESQGENGMS